MNVFELRDNLINDYKDYVRSFVRVRDPHLEQFVDEEFSRGAFWPDPLIQLNPSFEPGDTIDHLVDSGALHPDCRKIFRAKKSEQNPNGFPLRLHKHQSDAIQCASLRQNYVLTTGTGSGKSLSYIIPIVDFALRNPGQKRIKAIIVYPMNALANSQDEELRKFLCTGFPNNQGPVSFRRYTGQEDDTVRREVISNPPDILLTNFMMLELLMTRPDERALITAAEGLNFLVLDELHTYRGRQGADVAMLVRRVRERLNTRSLICVGTSATMSSAGSWAEQSTEVARVAGQIFGSDVSPESVVGETLRRVTTEYDATKHAEQESLRESVNRWATNPTHAASFSDFANDALSSWIESTFGLTAEPSSGRLIRSRPKQIAGEGGAAAELASIVGKDASTVSIAIQNCLFAGFACQNPDTGFPVFAFRVHQFISKGDTVYCSLEQEDGRYRTLQRQQFVPNDRSKVLLPLAFCRECGQEYYVVSRSTHSDKSEQFVPREFSERSSEDDSKAGYLYVSSDPESSWPSDPAQVNQRLPEEWLEETRSGERVKSNYRGFVPESLFVSPNGKVGGGLTVHFVPTPFKFCLACGVSYESMQRSEFAKLSPLSSEGKATATTILSLSTIRNLKADEELKPEARKLLSFTDNRQDASLQAGHFNDFIQTGILRAGLFKAVVDAGPNGLTHDTLTDAMFRALSLSRGLYAANPEDEFGVGRTDKAFKNLLGYRIYRDLDRGWKVTAPNLEQCGLLEIHYDRLQDVCASAKVWDQSHTALRDASIEQRTKIAKSLLDYLRKSLSIKTDYLDSARLENFKTQSNVSLKLPWAFDEDEDPETSTLAFPRPRRDGDPRFGIFIGPRSLFARYLKRRETLPDIGQPLTGEDLTTIIQDLFEGLTRGGLLTPDDPSRPRDRRGYRISSDSLIWKAGSGENIPVDALRVTRASPTGNRPNQFFLKFYRDTALALQGLEAREHTAQVPSDERIKREQAFRKATLPILFCSPTMELGVDISELNVVNMRNIPPTPANYAQRSGRAGRSGQPALVFSFCGNFSQHDQYFFRRPYLMVAGVVTPPRLDLANADLLASHIHAVWLSESGVSLRKSLTEIVDAAGENPSLQIIPEIWEQLSRAEPKERTKRRVEGIIQSNLPALQKTSWFGLHWLEELLSKAEHDFERACERWRSLFRAAVQQIEIQHKIVNDAARSDDERKRAKRLRAEAESQKELLTDIRNIGQSDFYSYRYFASEGFLPGYNFPRLPISAYIPGRSRRADDKEFLSRPRFLAISEFGPRALIYHEGSRYRINRVILPVAADELRTVSAKLCPSCGYLHRQREGVLPDLCELCRTPLGATFSSLFRLQNVSTRREERILSDEEERQRAGFELRTTVRFSERTGTPEYRRGILKVNREELAELCYGDAATIWRINLGWKRRADHERHGFVLDLERGYWKNNDALEDDRDDPMGARTERVVPFVEDTRNVLLFQPSGALPAGQLASLQAALKNAIQVEFQLEENELAAEPLPERNDRRQILFFEAAEGGAGVLRKIFDEPSIFARIAKQALEICHFDPVSSEDRRRAEHSREDCEGACYSCLMSYQNQHDQSLLDRQSIKELLLTYSNATHEISSASVPRAEQFDRLNRLTQSDLERRWLRSILDQGYKLPTDAQELVTSCSARPDFTYNERDIRAAIYIDGPPHDYPDRQKRDQEQYEALEDRGFRVVRFHHQDDWAAILAEYSYIFGEGHGGRR